MSHHGVLLDKNYAAYGQPSIEELEELQRQALLKEHINLYYDDYYIKAKKKKTTKAKRSYSKKPGARGEYIR
jgi:hypothetical protein